MPCASSLQQLYAPSKYGTDYRHHFELPRLLALLQQLYASGTERITDIPFQLPRPGLGSTPRSQATQKLLYHGMKNRQSRILSLVSIRMAALDLQEITIKPWYRSLTGESQSS